MPTHVTVSDEISLICTALFNEARSELTNHQFLTWQIDFFVFCIDPDNSNSRKPKLFFVSLSEKFELPGFYCKLR